MLHTLHLIWHATQYFYIRDLPFVLATVAELIRTHGQAAVTPVRRSRVFGAIITVLLLKL